VKTFLIKVKIIAKDNRRIFLVVGLWFLMGACIYHFVLGLSLATSVRAAFFFKQVEGDFAGAYGIWTQAIIFGVILSLLFQNVIERYIPERSCRMLAKEVHDHIIVIGYSHLGRRLVHYFREKGIPYCVIEKDRENVDELLRLGEPVITDDAKELDALLDANIAEAKAVVVASNNLETALLVTKRARELNKNCRIVTRCYQDEFVEIIESLGANEVISSSKNAFDDIVARMES